MRFPYCQVKNSNQNYFSLLVVMLTWLHNLLLRVQSVCTVHKNNYLISFVLFTYSLYRHHIHNGMYVVQRHPILSWWVNSVCVCVCVSVSVCVCVYLCVSVCLCLCVYYIIAFIILKSSCELRFECEIAYKHYFVMTCTFKCIDKMPG